MTVQRKFWIAAGLLYPTAACAHPSSALRPDDLWSAWEFGSRRCHSACSICSALRARITCAARVYAASARVFLVRLDVSGAGSNLAAASARGSAILRPC